MKVEYSSNNSGGSFWLSDGDWAALEAAGWFVYWGGKYFCHSRFSSSKCPHGKAEPCGSSEACPGHRMADSAEEAKQHRWLGAIATSAEKEFPSIKDALSEFEKVTGQDVSEEGCNCCGAPHLFSWDGGYCSGSGCIEYLGLVVPASLREAAEMLSAHQEDER